MNCESFVIARRALLALVATVALAVPAQAGAATTSSISSGTLVVGGGTEANAVTVTVSGANFVVADANGAVSASTGCSPTADVPAKATCPTSGVTAVYAGLGAGEDSWKSSGVGLPTTVCAGTQDDTVTTGAGIDSLNGDGENDWMAGGPGNDNLNGGAGAHGVGYWDRTAGLTATLGEGATPGTGGTTGSC